MRETVTDGREMKIKFKKNDDGLCLTQCQFLFGNTRVGSLACKKCPFNDETNEQEQWVECHRAAHDAERDGEGMKPKTYRTAVGFETRCHECRYYSSPGVYNKMSRCLRVDWNAVSKNGTCDFVIRRRK